MPLEKSLGQVLTISGFGFAGDPLSRSGPNVFLEFRVVDEDVDKGVGEAAIIGRPLNGRLIGFRWRHLYEIRLCVYMLRSGDKSAEIGGKVNRERIRRLRENARPNGLECHGFLPL